MAGIYVHIPFCRKFCTYCNFYSVGRFSLRNNFVDAICREISQQHNFFNEIAPQEVAGPESNVIDTLYFGGGTPSVLEPQMLERICNALRSNFNLEQLQEFTIELNPNDVIPDFAAFLKGLGVNRVSIGIQSFDNAHLQWMNRRHNAAQAREAFHTLRTAGFSNISCDLIFGFPSLTGDSWENSIRSLLDLHPEHISCYQMSVKSGTPLARSLDRASDSYGNRVLEMPSQEECASQYALLQELLAQAGYLQYEISNFCLPGYHSRHNSSYWNNAPYLGLGPAAHSFNGNVREWNVPVMQRYINHFLNTGCQKKKKVGKPSPVKEKEILSEKDIFNEMLMLGLRQAKGIDCSKLEKNSFYYQIKDDLQRLVASGLLVKQNDCKGNYAGSTRLRIPADKFFVSDNIIRELFVI